MPARKRRVPLRRLHKPSGQAVVTLDGQDIYLGRYDSPASEAEYDRLIQEWLAAGRKLPDDPNAITIAEVFVAWREHARTYYHTSDGSVSRTVKNIEDAFRPVLKLYGKTPAADFGPMRLKAVRQTMINDQRVRTNINRLMHRIRQIFGWACENELIPARVAHALREVKALEYGRGEVVESEPVKPLPLQHVEAVIPHVSRQVGAMIRLQLLTAMRPGEVAIIRGADLDTTGRLWLFRPTEHKNQHRGHDRVIYLGPKAQEVVKPFLKMDTTAYLFAPADAEAERRARLSEARKTPLSCGNVPGSNLKRGKPRKFAPFYKVTAYYVAIRRACKKAGVPHWHPHRLRHTAATEMRRTHGLEASQVLLGNRTLQATQVYAERSTEKAMQIMAEVG